MAAKTKSFEFTTVVAETAQGMNIADTVRFHAFNPRGLVHEQRRIDTAVRALVDAGTVKSGALMAYGSLDHFNHDRLMDAVDSKPSSRSLSVTLQMYAERNAKARAFVSDLGGTVAEPVIESVETVRARREALIQELAAQADEVL